MEDVLKNEEDKSPMQQSSKNFEDSLDQNNWSSSNLMRHRNTASEDKWQIIPPSTFEMSSLAPPGAPNKKAARQLNAS